MILRHRLGSTLNYSASDFQSGDLNELEVLRLSSDAVMSLNENVEELSDPEIGSLQEAAQRGRFYGLFSHSTELGDAWWDLKHTLQKEVHNRYEIRDLRLSPTYVSEHGTESESILFDRLLKSWVVELEVISVKDENSHDPEVRTITAKANKEIPSIRAATAPWNSTKSFQNC